MASGEIGRMFKVLLVVQYHRSKVFKTPGS
jgi:hypothetical protein